MKREVCPNCGGVLAAESLGWKCKSCRGFISLQDGKFYEYVEKPFMPPQTNADRIRAMSDEELENGIRAVSLGHDPWCDHHCKMCGDDNCNSCLANWLRQPVKDGEDDGKSNDPE